MKQSMLLPHIYEVVSAGNVSRMSSSPVNQRRHLELAIDLEEQTDQSSNAILWANRTFRTLRAKCDYGLFFWNAIVSTL